MLTVRTDWTHEELKALLQDGDTRTERVPGTLLIQLPSWTVQFAVASGDIPDMGDAEYELTIDESPLPLPLQPGVYRVVAVGRVGRPSESFYEGHYGADGKLAQRVYRLDEYPMLRAGAGARVGALRDKRGNSLPVAITDEWLSYAYRDRVAVSNQAVSVRAPYNDAFVRRAKTLGGRWRPAEKVWVFPVQREDEVRRLVQEVYGG